MSSRGATITPADMIGPQYGPVQESFLSNLGAVETHYMKNIARQTREDSEFIPIAWNINRHLRKFFEDPDKFRYLLGKCDGIISGAFARKFIARTLDSMPENNMDMIINPGHPCDNEMTEYLQEHGYVESWVRESEDDKGRPYPCWEKNSGEKTLRISRPNIGNNLDIRRDSTPPIFYLLEYATHTAELNFLTWDKAYSLFPQATFIKKECFLVSHLAQVIGPALAKLSSEGIKIKGIKWNQKNRDVDGKPITGLTGSNDSLTRLRRVGDNQTWIFDLDTSNMERPETQEVPLTLATFKLSPDTGRHSSTQVRHSLLRNPVATYHLGVELLWHPVLKYKYTVAAEPPQYGFGCKTHVPYCLNLEELLDHLNDAFIIELTKLPVSHLAPQDLQGVYDNPSDARLFTDFVQPADWTFFDEEVRERLEVAWELYKDKDAEEQVENL